MLLNKLINENIKQDLMNDDLINKDMTKVRTPIILKHNVKRNQSFTQLQLSTLDAMECATACKIN
jgi:hypothetical protein